MWGVPKVRKRKTHHNDKKQDTILLRRTIRNMLSNKRSRRPDSPRGNLISLVRQTRDSYLYVYIYIYIYIHIYIYIYIYVLYIYIYIYIYSIHIISYHIILYHVIIRLEAAFRGARVLATRSGSHKGQD